MKTKPTKHNNILLTHLSINKKKLVVQTNTDHATLQFMFLSAFCFLILQNTQRFFFSNRISQVNKGTMTTTQYVFISQLHTQLHIKFSVFDFFHNKSWKFVFTSVFLREEKENLILKKLKFKCQK